MLSIIFILLLFLQFPYLAHLSLIRGNFANIIKWFVSVRIYETWWYSIRQVIFQDWTKERLVRRKIIWEVLEIPLFF